MKLVQFLRPLFLVALGLHALVLFLPTGDDDVVVIEDVALDELSEDRRVPLPNSTVPSVLPVPDPNVSTLTTSKPKSTPATVRPAATAQPAARSAARLSARPASAPAARPASGRPSANSSPTANNTSSQGALSGHRRASTTSPNASQSERDRTSTTETAPAEADRNSNDASSTGNTSTGNTSTGNTSTSNTSSNPPKVSVLLAQVTRDLPESLRALSARLDRSLTYDADNTDDASAQQAREDWQADIQRQANVGQIERMPLAEIAELTQIEYPLESSLSATGRSLRRCLPKDPKTAEVGVLFDSQGNIVDEPNLLRSTGYSALNEEIRSLVAAYDDFPSDRASKAYSFEVEVFYDSELCVTAADLQK